MNNSQLTVIFKKGDPLLCGNYRPVAIIPVMYKLFSRMLCDRLQPKFDEKQSQDQAAYRKGFSTEDHLLTVNLLLERSKEWGTVLWLGLVDFEKAFDTVEHDELWKTMVKQGVPGPYVDILKALYESQTATVRATAVSREFNIGRGVRQGDPLSALLFSMFMEDMVEPLKQKWAKLNQ